MKQIRITSNQFKTKDNFGTGRTLKDTRSKLEGRFEFSHGESVFLPVHPKNISMSGFYLALNLKWKLVIKH